MPKLHLTDISVRALIFGIEYRREGRKTYRFFALEADRGTMPITRAAKTGTSVLAKLGAYRDILAREGHRSLLGVPNLLVLTITTDQARCAELVRKFGEHAGEGAQFLFRAVGTGPVALAKPVPALLTEPWERSGLSPLHID